MNFLLVTKGYISKKTYKILFPSPQIILYKNLRGHLHVLCAGHLATCCALQRHVLCAGHLATRLQGAKRAVIFDPGEAQAAVLFSGTIFVRSLVSLVSFFYISYHSTY